ncbi:hypothetical protein ACOME3_008115 [Neoechinorhynchus agilis]
MFYMAWFHGSPLNHENRGSPGLDHWYNELLLIAARVLASNMNWILSWIYQVIRSARFGRPTVMTSDKDRVFLELPSPEQTYARLFQTKEESSWPDLSEQS